MSQPPHVAHARPSLLRRGDRAAWLAGAVGFLAGATAQVQGLYAVEQWAPIAMIVLLVLMVLAVAAPAGLRTSGIAIAVAMGALAAWQLFSTTYAESADQAALEAYRTFGLAAFAGLAVVLLQTPQARFTALAGVVAGALFIACVDLARLLADDPDLFHRGRLDSPLGYVNGQAFALLIPFWPLVLAAERTPRSAAAGAALAGATACLGLALLTASRGAFIALAASVLLMLALVPGRGRRAVALVLVAVPVAAVEGVLRAVYDGADPATGYPAAGDARSAALAVLLAAAVSGALHALARHTLLRPGRLSARRQRTVAHVSLAAVAAGALVLAPAALRRADRVIDDFVELRPVTVTDRFSSGGGNRYDFWRVAVEEFRDEPLTGLGAGNYDVRYFRLRRSLEDVRQPHSLPLQVAAETGVVGLAIFAAIVGLLLAGAIRALRERAGRDRLVAAGAIGLIALWALQTSVDWLHLLPGPTAAVLLAVAAVVVRSGGEPPRWGVRVRPVLFAAAMLLVAAIGVHLLADRKVAQARELAAADPARAARAAEQALRLNDEDVEGYIAFAAAEARRNRYESAKAALLEAARREPSDFVPPALLGDLATRRGDQALALESYRRASRLNPLDPTLKALSEPQPASR